MAYFKYGKKEITYLKKSDSKMKLLIEEVGMISRPINKDLYSSLLNSIISQQISSAAQKTIFKRLQELVNPLIPAEFLKKSKEEIQACGISWRKVDYMINLTEKIINNELDLNSLRNLSDEEVINELTKLKGIGVWTAEMLLIFSLERENVISYLDLAIIRGLKRLHQKDEISKEDFNYYQKLYTPYNSVASLYLWHLAALEDFEFLKV